VLLEILIFLTVMISKHFLLNGKKVKKFHFMKNGMTVE